MVRRPASRIAVGDANAAGGGRPSAERRLYVVMATETRRSRDSTAWALAESQHWVLTTRQLRDLGFTEAAVRHRVRAGRHPVFRGVYAVGRPTLSRLGRWKAATLSVGPGAALSHLSAGAVHEIAREGPAIEVWTPGAPSHDPGSSSTGPRSSLSSGWCSRASP